MANAAAAMTTTNQQTPDDPVRAMKRWIAQSSNAFAKILPKHVSAERFLKVAQAAITKTPRLAECDPRSVIMALIHCSELGLEPNSPLQHAFLIPYKARKCFVRELPDGRQIEQWDDAYECQLQIGYRGLLHLARQSGALAAIAVRIVYEGDKFQIIAGDEEKIVHEPTFKADPGNMIGAYMVVRLADGSVQREWMTRAEIERIRDKSQGWAAFLASKKKNKSSPWSDHFEEMARKTVFKRGSKWIPMSPEKEELLARAIEIDNRVETAGKAAISPEVIEDLPVNLRPTADEQVDQEGADVIEVQAERATVPELAAKPASTPAEELKAQLRAHAAAEVAKQSVLAPATPSASESTSTPATVAAGEKKKRTLEEARAAAALLENELHGEIEALHSLEECDGWSDIESVKKRRAKLASEQKQRVTAHLAKRKASFEPPEEEVVPAQADEDEDPELEDGDGEREPGAEG